MRQEEIAHFSRRPELPGLEVRTVENTSRTWRCYSTDFEFMLPSSWHGEIAYRGRVSQVNPETVFCSHPGEVFAARRVLQPGSGRSLTMDPRIFEDYLADHQLPAHHIELSSCVPVSEALRAQLTNVFDAFEPHATALQLESSLVDFVALVVNQLSATSRNTKAAPEERRIGERVRDCLYENPSATIDLSTLAKDTGLSRFQALRAFKRQYGLPPHTYQLRIRIGLAQRLLRQGCSPVQVAADLGFVDQSHLNRHFKRLTGMTPAQYARVGTKAARGLPRVETSPPPPNSETAGK